MINANATLGGGCPVPPPPNSFLSRVGQGLGATVDFASNPESLWGEATEAEVIRPLLVLMRCAEARFLMKPFS